MWEAKGTRTRLRTLDGHLAGLRSYSARLLLGRHCTSFGKWWHSHSPFLFLSSPYCDGHDTVIIQISLSDHHHLDDLWQGNNPPTTSVSDVQCLKL